MKKYWIPFLAIALTIGLVYYVQGNLLAHPNPTSVDAKQELLQQPKLAQLFESKDRSSFGFFGKNNAMIEYYISSATLSTTKPGAIIVVGKTKFKKTITDFTGEMMIESVSKNSFLDKKTLKGNVTYTNYQIQGTWHFAENKNEKFAGEFNGKWQADAYSTDKWKEMQFGHEGKAKSLTNNNDLVLKGTWVSYATPVQTKQVSFSNNIGVLGNSMFKNFYYYGDREEGIDPKFAKNGWDHYYDNEEWWAKK
jgi:hypothetical protein